jgi:pyruvate/2-oxoglutarate dehydrogenase complex dihydrolipoamide acyltransferase (E2) component
MQIQRYALTSYLHALHPDHHAAARRIDCRGHRHQPARPVGDQVQTDQDIIEVETNKATMNVAAPCSGRVEKLLVKLGESYPVGAVLGFLEASAEDAARLGWMCRLPATPAGSRARGASLHGGGTTDYAEQERSADCARPARAGQRRRRQLYVAAHEGAHDGAGPARGRPCGPARQRRRRARHHPGFREVHRPTSRNTSSARHPRCAWPWPTRCGAVGPGPSRPWRCPSVSMPCWQHRKACRSQARSRALCALRALALALSENSAPAGRLIGNKIVHPTSIDVGFAVEAEEGVLVPVIRNADKRPLKDLVKRYNELVELARQRKLPPTPPAARLPPSRTSAPSA